jgi:hypothetical protein
LNIFAERGRIQPHSHPLRYVIYNSKLQHRHLPIVPQQANCPGHPVASTQTHNTPTEQVVIWDVNFTSPSAL